MPSPFRLKRSRDLKKQYTQLDETSALLAQRRGSTDSDQTLVDEDGARSSPVAAMDSNALLAILAPLVGALQRLTPRLNASSAPNDIFASFIGACTALTSLLTFLQRCSQDHEHASGDAGYDLDAEMRSLMLEALGKKVEMERHKIRRPSHDSDRSLISTTSTANTPFTNSSSSSISPLSPSHTKNPFVVHATSVHLSSSRVSVGGKAIPQAPSSRSSGSSTGGVAIANYGNFAGGGQASWAMNVIRLGSYQNSMLFSPSPVAVRRGIHEDEHYTIQDS
jgi:hypothetical protein